MPPQLPWPGHACSARRARTSGSGSAAYWNAVTRSMRSPVTGSMPGVDRAVGEHQRRGVVLEQRGQRADGRLVARDDRDDARHVVGLEVRLGAVVDQLATRQRVAHPVGAVELAVGDAQRERRSDETHGEVVVVDPLRQRFVHRVDLRPHAEVALAVAERADDAPHGVVHLGDVLTQEAGGPDALDVASGVPRHELTGERRAHDMSRSVPSMAVAHSSRKDGATMSVLVTTTDGYHIFTSSGKHLTVARGSPRRVASRPAPTARGSRSIDAARGVAARRRRRRGRRWRSRDADAHRGRRRRRRGVRGHRTTRACCGSSDAGRRRAAAGVRHRRRPRRVAPGRHPAAGALDDRDRRRRRGARQRARGRHPASVDGGATWHPTIAVDDDVHQVLAHPTRPEIVVAAASVGLCRSTDGGATWTSIDRRHGHHLRARRRVRGRRRRGHASPTAHGANASAVYRAPVDGGPVDEGRRRPAGDLHGNVDYALHRQRRQRAWRWPTAPATCGSPPTGVEGFERVADRPRRRHRRRRSPEPGLTTPLT